MDLLESVAAIYDIGKDIINNGAMPDKIWDQGRRSRSVGPDAAAKAAYDKSPFKAPAVISGCANQLIDEITGVVQLVKTGIEIVRKPRETVSGIWNGIKTLNGDKLKQMLTSASGVAEYTAGGDRAKHQGGKHGVQAAMLIIGPVKTLTNGKEVLEGAGNGISDVQKFIPDGTTGHPSANALKNAADNGKVVKKIDDDKVLTKNIEGGQEKVVVIDKNGEVYSGNATHSIDGVGDDVLQTADPDDIVDMHTDPVINNEVKTQPQRFKDGKAFERNISNDPAHTSKVQTASGVNLAGFNQGSQVQIKMADGSYIVADNVWYKEVVVNGQTKFEIVINESKLSSAAPFSANQNKFIQEVTNGTTNFELRTSKFSSSNSPMPKGAKLELKAIVKTVGNGTTGVSSYTVTKIP